MRVPLRRKAPEEKPLLLPSQQVPRNGVVERAASKGTQAFENLASRIISRTPNGEPPISHCASNLPGCTLNRAEAHSRGDRCGGHGSGARFPPSTGQGRRCGSRVESRRVHGATMRHFHYPFDRRKWHRFCR
jgi:hypothetical protein